MNDLKRPAGQAPAVEYEHSAGGVVINRKGEVLLIRTRDLENRPVLTYPKGHLEKGETPGQAALRETLEETGWKCSIIKELGQTGYCFIFKGRQIDKKVDWFLMKPEKRVSGPDTGETEGILWLKAGVAAEKLSYPADRLLLKKTGQVHDI